MIEYILVLTLLGAASNGGVAISQVGGFKDVGSCMQAGQLWRTGIQNNPQGHGRPFITFLPREMAK